MSVYTGFLAIATPSTTDDNWTIQPVAGESGMILECGWGGEATASTAMRTRVTSGWPRRRKAGGVRRRRQIPESRGQRH